MTAQGLTLASASSRDKDIKAQKGNKVAVEQDGWLGDCAQGE